MMRYLLAILLAVPVLAAEPHESAELAAQREKMKNLKRRIIYNNDGCDIFNPGADTPEGFLAQRMKATLGSQVDSVFYCTGATVLFSHDTKLGDQYGRYPVEPEWAQSLPANMAGMKEAGTDTLTLIIEFCRKHNLEVFYTHRINDIHDSIPNLEFELADWKRKNPQFLIAKREEQHKYRGKDPRYWWSAFDFEHQEVLDYIIAIIDELFTNYDIDGYEVDYFRSPFFFKPNLDYKPVTVEQTNILTGFQRRIRELAYEHGNRRGKPILVSVRTPTTVERSRHVGIDVERWLREDLFDVLTISGGYVPYTMPIRDMIKLGHAYGKPVYPTISGSGLRDKFRATPAWRGAAMNSFANGADGIVLFNTFPRHPGHPRFTELGDPEKLKYMAKLFAIDNKKVTEGDLEQGIAQDQIIPLKLPAKQSARTNLPIGDDIAAAAKAGRLKNLTMHVRYEGVENEADVRIRMNGRAVPVLDENRVSSTVPGKNGLAYRFVESNVLSAGNGSILQLGDSDFSFSLWIKTTQRVDWSGFIVFVEVNEQRPGVKLYWNAGTLNFSLRAPDGERNWNVDGGDIIGDGQWHHYAATFDRQGGAKAYLDGKLVGVNDISGLKGSLGASKTLLFGTGDVPYSGLMDDVQLYNRVLTAQQVQQLGAGSPPSQENLIGRWKFDEPNGLTFEDSSDNDSYARPYTKGGGQGWKLYAPDPATIKQGDNNLIFSSPTAGRVTNVELHVEYTNE